MAEPVRLRVRDEIVEFEPTAETPILLLNADPYNGWIRSIADKKTKARIILAISRMRRGLLGNWKDVGKGVFELRLDFGPGYRIYYAKVGRVLLVLLGGGDKSSQQRDITRAQEQ